MVHKSFVLDTLAIISYLLGETQKDQIAKQIYCAEEIFISAGTLSELFNFRILTGSALIFIGIIFSQIYSVQKIKLPSLELEK